MQLYLLLGVPLIWGGNGWIMDNKSPLHPRVAAPTHLCVNKVLCHHLKPKRPLAEKTQHQLPPELPTLTCTSSPSPSSTRPALEHSHFLPIKLTLTVSSDKALQVSEGQWRVFLIQHISVVDYSLKTTALVTKVAQTRSTKLHITYAWN